METVLKAIADWIKGILTAGIMSNLSGLFDDVNTQVGNIAQQVGTKPSSFEPRVFAMIEALSRNVVLPIAGIILTFIACYELIEMITQHNNMAQFEPALIMRWIFKTAVSVWLISNTFNIVMAVFDITQKVVSDSSGIIAGNTRVNDIGLSMLEASLMQMDVGPLFGLFLQSFFIGITMRILSIIIFVIVYGRMIEIYCMVSLAPIPMATWGNHEQSHMGQNYLKCLFALGFQGFLILICVAIYAVLIQSVAISGDAINAQETPEEDADNTIRELMKEWNTIGHVPFKEKDKLYKQYHAIIDKLFDKLNLSASQKKLSNFKSNIGKEGNIYREREKLVRAYENMKNEIQTYENNLGFLTSSSKKGSNLVTEMNRKVEKLKADLELILKKIEIIDQSMSKE